jgi:hypothetical protein
VIDIELARKRAEDALERAEKVSDNGWDEEWRVIAGCPDYEVSNMGNVRSYLRKGNWKKRHSGFPRLLKISGDKFSRPTVALPSEDGSYRTRQVSRIVAETFHGPIPADKEVAHLDGNPSNNRANNLLICSHTENESHKVGHGTVALGEKNGGSRLLGWQVSEIRYLLEHGIPQIRLKELFDVSADTINAIAKGETWKEFEARSDVPALAHDLLQALEEIERLHAVIERGAGLPEGSYKHLPKNDLEAEKQTRWGV